MKFPEKKLRFTVVIVGISLIPLLGVTHQLTKEMNKTEEQQQEINNLGKALFSLRTKEIVIENGEVLGSLTLKIQDQHQIKQAIDELLQKSNAYVFSKIKPDQEPNERILFVMKDDIEELKTDVSGGGDFVINVRSAGNFILGENAVYGYTEILSKTE